MKIAVLCAMENSNYYKFNDLEIYDKNRDAYTFNSHIPIIAHPPCAQWSRLRYFANEDINEKNLAVFCYEKILENGGILEHPSGSSLFKYLGIKPTISIDQNWFGFPARKRTYLYFHRCEPLSYPLSFELPKTIVPKIAYRDRSVTTLQFAKWLIDCINVTYK